MGNRYQLDEEFVLCRSRGGDGHETLPDECLALRDYYIEKGAMDSGASKGPDSWAVEYINIGRAQGILEAFDDDASGFVTVNEVNNLTQLRPRDWRCALSSLASKDNPFTQIAVFPTG